MNINNNNKQNPNNENQRRPRFNFTWLYMILFGGLVFMYFFSNSSGSSDKQLGYTDFQACLDSGYVKEILVNKDNLTLKFAVDKKGEKYIYNNVQSNNKPPRTPVIEFGSLTNLEQKIDSAKAHNKFTGKVSYERENDLFWNILIQIGPIVLIVIIWFFIMGRMGGGALGGGGGIFSFGKSKAKLFEQGEEKDRITFKDVAGQTEAKREVHEIVDFLKNPSKYTELGGKIPKGALLVGPPGTGKTLLAKAVAG